MSNNRFYTTITVEKNQEFRYNLIMKILAIETSCDDTGIAILEVKSKKLVSLDKEITIVLNTSDLIALQLAMIDTDKIIKVSIEIQ